MNNNRADLWQSWVQKTQKKVEDDLRRGISGYLRGAKRRFTRIIKNNNINTLLSIVEEQRQEESRLLKLGYQGRFIKWYQITGNKELDRAYDIANVTRPLDLVFGRRQLAVQLSDKAAKEMTKTTIESVESIIQKGLIDGLSVQAIASKLEVSLVFSEARSLRIARTESTRAVNSATDQAYRLAEANGINIKKQWLSSRDAKVREAHAELDGVIVGVNEEFESEGYTSSSPANFGDPSLDVNCRCTIIPVIDGETEAGPEQWNL